MTVSPKPFVSVIDDDEGALAALVGLFLSAGFDASGHTCAEDFLSSGETQSAACIVTDLTMPGMSGVDLKQRLDALAPETPVIVITARDDGELYARALASGFLRVLTKPFFVNELVDELRRATTGRADT